MMGRRCGGQTEDAVVDISRSQPGHAAAPEAARRGVLILEGVF